MISKNYLEFISEQKEYFLENIQPTFKNTWNESLWIGGSNGSGWLISRSGKTYLNFGIIKNLKGIEDVEIDEEFQIFMKSVIVLSYRQSNKRASPQKLYAEMLILKRWYSALVQHTQNHHACSLTTEILNIAFDCLFENSSKINLPDHAGSFIRIQKMINHYGFTESQLEFVHDLKYINRQNRTPNAKRTKALIDQLELDENDLESNKLVSVQTFINIVALSGLCQTTSEKIALNFLLLLIITGFRSTEAILLKRNALIKKKIIDPITQEHLTLDGVQQYSIGIRYHGAKGVGERIHWLEPTAGKLAEIIFESVEQLTKEYRAQIQYIKSKKIVDFLPLELDEIPGDEIVLEDLIDTIFKVRKISEYKYRINYRAILLPSIKKIPVLKEIKIGNKINTYYLKKDINNYIKSLTPNFTSGSPFVHVLNGNGVNEEILYEDLLFLHEYKSLNFSRKFSHKSNIIPFTCLIINNFLGNGQNLSIFEKYYLKENDAEYSKLSTHIPRHNINTFLALSGLSEHLQALLMGRIDIKQNQYYQHVAIKHRKIAASLLDKHELIPSEHKENYLHSNPVESIKHDGYMYFSKDLDLESNLKMNLHSFDNKNEISEHIKNSFFEDIFSDITEAFNELSYSDLPKADSLVKRHAYLHPLPFGACMRDVTVHDCPKRMACQSGDKCGNFTITHRKGELDNLESMINSLIVNYHKTLSIVQHDKSYTHMLSEIKNKISNLNVVKERALSKRNDLTPIRIFDYIDESIKLPHTLSELFAIEQHKIESSKA